MRGARVSHKWETWDYSNVTTKVMKVLHSPRGRLVQIELLVCVAAFLLIFLELFGAYRRRCNNGKLRAILWIAYNIPPYLIAYTFGLMHAAPFKNQLFPMWATFLMMLLGSADSFSALNLEDNEQWKRYSSQFFVKYLGLWLIAILYVGGDSSLTLATYLLYCILTEKVLERALASMLASKAIRQQITKKTVDYTRKELDLKEDPDEVVDLTTMEGYTYLVRRKTKWEDKKISLLGFIRECLGMKTVVKSPGAQAPDYHVPLKLGPKDITVEKVWQCQGKLLREDNKYRIKDLCLSFALFRILSSRFAGYSMPRKVHQKSWKLFREIISSPVPEDGYERAFRIIEVELAFVFYQFYTKYAVIFRFYSPWVMKIVKLVYAIICLSLVASNIWPNQKIVDNVQLTISKELSVDVLVTTMVIIAIPVVEILQLVLMIFSEYGKVAWICKYVRRESWQNNKYIEKLIKSICYTEIPRTWERKLRQYSLLESYDYSPPLLLYNNLTTTIKKGQKQSTPTELSTEVKLAVIKSLPKKGSNLENGKISLTRNNMPKEEYFWACDLETQAQVIMVWHIATSMCEYEFRANPYAFFLENCKIATSLSKYLAYLVAFAPRLLPDRPYYVTEYVFKQVIIEARIHFKGCSSLQDKIIRLKDSLSGESGETVIHRGARLGKKLLDTKSPEMVWKFLAEFWAELMLYVAPSDDMDAHAIHLSMGGEFITQIWALLWHSDIERDPPCKTPKLKRSQSWT